MKNILLFITCAMFFITNINAQEGKLKFTHTKPTTDGYTAQFNAINIMNDSHGEQILNALLSDNNISKAKFFISGEGKERFQIYASNNVTAEYVRNILLEHGSDFDYTTVSVNGVLKERSSGKHIVKPGLGKYRVNSESFPNYSNTEEPEKDREEYHNKKTEWIEKNPEEYEKLLREQAGEETN